MKIVTEYKSKPKIDINSTVKVLFISSDILALVPYENMNDSKIDKDWVLLFGNDFNGGYLITDEQTIANITHKCYNARETQIPYTFTFDSKVIIFM